MISTRPGAFRRSRRPLSSLSSLRCRPCGEKARDIEEVVEEVVGESSAIAVWSYVAVVVVARRHRRPRRRRRRRPRRRHRRRPCRPRFRNLHRQQQQQPQQQQQRVESRHQFTFRGGWEGARWEERRTPLE